MKQSVIPSSRWEKEKRTGYHRDCGDTVTPSSRWESNKNQTNHRDGGDTGGKMKTIMLIVVLLISTVLFSQLNYTLTHYTFNAGGGFQSGNIYTSVFSYGEKVQGDISSTNYEGYLGFLFPYLDQRIPVITSIADVPNDQGLQVQVVWNKCGYDDVYAIDTFYSLWRYDEEFEVVLTGGNQEGNTSLRNSSQKISAKNRSAKLKSSKQESLKSKKDVFSKLSQNIYTEPLIIIEKARQNPNKTYYWQRGDRDIWTFIAEIPALNYDEYSVVAPTLMDSSNTGTNYSTFKVVYHDLYQYYESVPDSGYSVDNIAPDPTRTTIARNGNFMKLEWDEVAYGTFEGNRYPELNGIWYKVYAGDVPDFVCDAATYLTTITDLEYNYPLTGEPKKFYKVVVSDKP